MNNSNIELARWVPGPLRVTVAYVAMYYVLLFSQSVLKLYLYSAAKKYKKSDDRVSLTRMKYFRFVRLQVTSFHVC